MRLATWNLKECPTPQGARGQRIREMLADFNADITLFTEVHADWTMDDQAVPVSPLRVGYRRQHRLAGVHSSLPLDRLEGQDHHPAEEALCLVRVKTPESPTHSVLVACSVMPWRGAAKWWSGLREISKGEGLAPQFSTVLQHHVGRIDAERLPNEPVVWGGDFNQELSGPIKAGTVEGRAELSDTFKLLELEPLTMNSRHLVCELSSIDHLAVSSDWMTWGEPEVHGRSGTDFPSDHALYEVEGASWPEDMPFGGDGRIEEGLVVWSRSGTIEGRTTGSRLRCSSIGCPGWFIGVSWETGQSLKPCSQGWCYDPVLKIVRITGGGEISARFVSPPPLGTPPLPREQWPTRESLANGKGWRVSGIGSAQ